MDSGKNISKPAIAVIVIVLLLFSGVMWFIKTSIPGEEKMLSAIRQAEMQYGANSPKMVSILSLAAAQYQLVGHPGKAIDIYKRIIAIDEKTSGRESDTVVRSRHQLALLYDLAGDTEKADGEFLDICNIEKKLMKNPKSAGSGAREKHTRAYKSYVGPWLEARIIQLQNRAGDSNETDKFLLSSYQSRLKLCVFDNSVSQQGG